jgi:hypothetical protein
MPRWRFRLRTLLTVSAVVALAAGGVRWWYDARVAEHDRQKLIAGQLTSAKASILWSYVGPRRLELWKLFDGPAFQRPTHAYCDDVTTDAFAEVAPQLTELVGLNTLFVLGRQIMPHARTAHSGDADAVIETLREHSTLRQLVVDASIRGTPAEFEAPIYTREDLALLEEVLPELEIVWIEVN